MALNETSPLLRNDLWEDTENTPRNDNDDAKQSQHLSRAEITALVAALLGVLLSSADDSIVLAIHETVASKFDRLSSSSWMITGFTLGYCATLPLYGQLSDTYGRQGLLVIAYILFGLGGLLSAMGKDYWQIIAGRILSGSGSSGMVSLISIMITDIAPPSEVAILRSYVNVVSIIGHASGGPLGGILTEGIGWRWLFATQAPAAGLCCLLCLWSLKSIKLSGRKEAQTKDHAEGEEKPGILSFDFGGAISITMMVASLLFIIELKKTLAWSDHLVIEVVTFGLTSFIAFIAIERFFASKPLIPLWLLRTAVGIFCVQQIIFMIGRWAFVSNIAPYFSRTQDFSDAEAGTWIVPSSVGTAFGGLFSGYIIKRSGHYKLLTMLSLISSVFCILLIVFSWLSPVDFRSAILVLPAGVFAGIFFSSSFVGLSLCAPKKHMATAISCYYISQELGGAIGTSLGAGLLEVKFRAMMEERLDNIPDFSNIIERVLKDSSFTSSLSATLREQIQDCYLQSFWVVPTIYLCSQLLALIPTLCADEKHVSEQETRED